MRRGEVSYYNNASVDPRWGGYTKSGVKFDENKLTAAVPPILWGKLKNKIISVYNPVTNKSVDVKVIDTGGFANKEHNFRILDLLISRIINSGRKYKINF